MRKETILTGVRANDLPHIGHFLGVYVPMVALAQKYADQGYNINMFIPDLHSLTTPIDYKMLAPNIITGVKYYLAAGLDARHPNIHIYRQSYVPAHSELAWILDCFTNFGEMSRMTQFKEKSAEHSGNVSVGLFNYPVLMAADILLYSAKYVPVGEDQFQHVEITRDIAMRFNGKFGDIFTIPLSTAGQMKFMGRENGLRIRDLVNPEKKMSKSAPNEKSKIMLGDDPEAAAKKIMSATTDSAGRVQFDIFNQPGISNLLTILALLRGQPLAEVAGAYAGQTQYGDLKTDVAATVKQFLTDFQARVAAISDAEVLEILQRGEAEMRKVAEVKLLEVQKAVGLR